MKISGFKTELFKFHVPPHEVKILLKNIHRHIYLVYLALYTDRKGDLNSVIFTVCEASFKTGKYSNLVNR